MARRNTKWILLGALVVALALQAAVVFGATDRILFRHSAHQEALDDCDACHAAIRKDQGLFKMRPEKKTCAQCHDVEAKDQCGNCHTNAAHPSGWKREARQTNFLHSVHAAQLKNCRSCHAGDLDAKVVKKGDHAGCGKCHDQDIRDLLCAKCHRDFAAVGLKALNEFTHEGNFLKEHKDYARRSLRVCAQCHREAYCQDCHSRKAGLQPSLKYPEQVRRNFVHRGDVLTMHRLEAKTDDSACLKCHARSECRTCHERQNVAATVKQPAGRHPAGWVAKGGANFHGGAARRDIVSCATCHHGKGPGYCVDCHAASLGIDPHPRGWRDKVRGMNTNDRMCARCHKR